MSCANIIANSDRPKLSFLISSFVIFCMRIARTYMNAVIKRHIDENHFVSFRVSHGYTRTRTLYGMNIIINDILNPIQNSILWYRASYACVRACLYERTSWQRLKFYLVLVHTYAYLKPGAFPGQFWPEINTLLFSKRWMIVHIFCWHRDWDMTTDFIPALGNHTYVRKWSKSYEPEYFRYARSIDRTNDPPRKKSMSAASKLCDVFLEISWVSNGRVGGSRRSDGKRQEAQKIKMDPILTARLTLSCTTRDEFSCSSCTMYYVARSVWTHRRRRETSSKPII